MWLIRLQKAGDNVTLDLNRCPKCGSSPVIKIDGRPTLKPTLFAEKGEKLGECCLHSALGYLCQECEYKWNKQEAINQAYEKIRGIKASVGGYFGGFYQVQIDLTLRKLSWIHLERETQDRYEKTIRRSTVDRLIKELKGVDILNWNSTFVEPGICDGTEWSVQILSDGRTLEKSGVNKFPAQWDRFCRIIRRVTGKSFR